MCKIKSNVIEPLYVPNIAIVKCNILVSFGYWFIDHPVCGGVSPKRVGINQKKRIIICIPCAYAGLINEQFSHNATG